MEELEGALKSVSAKSKSLQESLKEREEDLVKCRGTLSAAKKEMERMNRDHQKTLDAIQNTASSGLISL